MWGGICLSVNGYMEIHKLDLDNYIGMFPGKKTAGWGFRSTFRLFFLNYCQ